MLNLGLTHHPTAKHYRDIINVAGKIKRSLSGLNVSIQITFISFRLPRGDASL